MKPFVRKSKVLVILVIMFSLSCVSHHVREDSAVSQRQQVLNKAINWVVTHPANFQEGGFLEMGEEANLHYILYTKAQSPEKKKFYRDQVAGIIKELRAQNNFQIQIPGDISAYLMVAKIAKRLDFDTQDFHRFIKRHILTNPMTYPPNMSYVILNSSLLRDLEYEPRVPLEVSIEQGVIVTMTKDNFLIPIGKSYVSDKDVTNYFYDVTHEIFALASFGDKDPEQMLMAKEIEFVRRMLAEGISLYLPKKQLDILCELVVCAKMMNYTDFPGYQETLDFILNAQQEDGAFGLIPRMKDLGRGNLYRHGVLVAAWALGS